MVVVLTKEREVDEWWPEEGDEHSYSLVLQGKRSDSEALDKLASTFQGPVGGCRVGRTSL